MPNTSMLAVMALLALSASTIHSLPSAYDTVHPPASSPPDQFAMLALDTLNKMRTASGLQPLCISAKLQKASQEHSNWMSQTQIFEHSQFGFMENIAVHGYDLPGEPCFGNGAEKATDLRSSAEFTTNCQWKNSEGHYRNMMDPKHTRAGIAYAIGPFDGFKGYWWTQNFDSSNEPCISGGAGSAPVTPPRNSQAPIQPTSTAVAPPRRSAPTATVVAPPPARSQPAAPSAPATRSTPAATTKVNAELAPTALPTNGGKQRRKKKCASTPRKTKAPEYSY